MVKKLYNQAPVNFLYRIPSGTMISGHAINNMIMILEDLNKTPDTGEDLNKTPDTGLQSLYNIDKDEDLRQFQVDIYNTLLTLKQYRRALRNEMFKAAALLSDDKGDPDNV